MSNHSDQQRAAGSVSGSVTESHGSSSFLTTPLLRINDPNDGEFVSDTDVPMEKTSDLMKSMDQEFTGSSMSNSSVSTVQFNTECSTARKLTGVCSKYQEAAIYLKEGIENEKLCHHPTDTKSYWAYKAIHHPVYYITEFIVCVLLMLLAFLEEPSFFDDVPLQVAPCLELLFLLYIYSDIILKLIWIKPKYTIKHRRTVFKCVLLVVMTMEDLIILGRGSNHVRVTRALRPLFLVDTILLQDVRRILRQIFLSLGPIIDVMMLLFFFVTIFALSGYYLFAETNYEFRYFTESLVNLYILATTANFPDVMMESYKTQPLAPLFFVAFLIVVLYIINNVLLAMVYSTFQDNQREKFKKLYLHRRNALRHAFYLLADKGPEQTILSLQNYLQMLDCYSPYTSKLIGICTFKAMMKEDRVNDEEESLSIEEFYSFYDIQRLKWSKVTGHGEKIRWYHIMPHFAYTKLKLLTKGVRSMYFKAIMNLVVLSNALYYIILTAHIRDPARRYERSQEAIDVNFVYVGIYILEIIIKLVALGPIHYVRSFWNIFDFVVIAITFPAQLLEINHHHFVFLVPLRFVRLVRFNKRFRAICNTLAVLLPQVISTIILLLLIYYFFAIIGMEAFKRKVYQYCCNDNNTNIGSYYTGIGSNVYYLNNFDHLVRSYVTLFELMVVNNWFVIMEGFHNAVGHKASRTYFILFHLTTIVVLTVVIAFIVDAFVFKIQLAHQRLATKNRDEYTLDGEFLKRYEVEVKRQEVVMIEVKFKRAYWAWELPSAFREQIFTDTIPLIFQGIRRRTRGDLHKQLFKDHIVVSI